MGDLDEIYWLKIVYISIFFIHLQQDFLIINNQT